MTAVPTFNPGPTVNAIRADNLLQKLKIQLSCSHERLWLFRMVSLVGFRPGCSKAREKALRKNFRRYSRVTH
jgi:hypothetical protein